MRNSSTITYLIIGAAIGLFFAVQLQSNTIVETSAYPADEIEARKTLLDNLLAEQNYLQSRVVNLRNSIDEARSQIEDQSQEANIEELDRLKALAGLSDVEGPGIIVTLDDNPLAFRDGVDVSETNLVQAADLRDIVNILNAAKANAISINGQRIIATTSISSVGTTLLVNNSPLAPPFEVSAVGDGEIILQRLLNEDLLPSIYQRAKNNSIVLKIVASENINIPIYNGDIKSSELNLVE